MSRVCADTLRRVFVSVAVSSILSYGHAHAVFTNWNTNSNGIFTTPANWDNGVPDSDDVAVFNRGTGITYSVTFPGGSILNPPPNYLIDHLYLRVNSNSVSFVWVNSPSQTIPRLTVLNPDVSIVIGENDGDVAVLTSNLANLLTHDATLGNAAGSSGTLNLTTSNATFHVTGTDEVYDLIVEARSKIRPCDTHFLHAISVLEIVVAKLLRRISANLRRGASSNKPLLRRREFCLSRLAQRVGEVY